MAHAYTPGLKVLHETKIDKERRLPLKGTVTVEKGKFVTPDDIVAKTDLPGNSANGECGKSAEYRC